MLTSTIFPIYIFRYLYLGKNLDFSKYTFKYTDEDINFRYATALFKSGNNYQAIQILQNCQKLKCKELSDTIKSYCVDRWHFIMLNDEIRNYAFYQWLKNSITKNDFVLDIGTGSGILSLFATKFRPKRVIACEASKTLFGIAKKVIEKNNSCQVIDLKHCLSGREVVFSVPEI